MEKNKANKRKIEDITNQLEIDDDNSVRHTLTRSMTQKKKGDSSSEPILIKLK